MLWWRLDVVEELSLCEHPWLPSSYGHITLPQCPMDFLPTLSTLAIVDLGFSLLQEDLLY